MRTRRVDKNQVEIVKVLRQMGASVLHTHELGRGAPDISVGYRKRNYFVEIKDGAQPPSRQVLTPDEQQWHDDWRGHVTIIRSVAEAVQFMHMLASD